MRTLLIVLCLLWAYEAAARVQSAENGTAVAIRSYHDALRLARDGRLDDALEALRRSIRADPPFARAYAKTIEWYQRRQQPDAAQRYFEQLLDLPGMAPYANYALGLLYLREKQAQAAEVHLKRCIDMAPEFAPAYTQLAGVSLQNGSGGETATYFRKLVEANPKNAAAHYGLAYLYQQQNQAQPAREELERANDLTPELWEVLYLRYGLFAIRPLARGASRPGNDAS